MAYKSILTRRPPYHDISSDVQVITAVCSGILPSAPSDFQLWPIRSQILWGMCGLCWKPAPLREPIQNFVLELQVTDQSSFSYLPAASSYRFNYLLNLPASTHQIAHDRQVWSPGASNDALISDQDAKEGRATRKRRATMTFFLCKYLSHKFRPRLMHATHSDDRDCRYNYWCISTSGIESSIQGENLTETAFEDLSSLPRRVVPKLR